MKSSNTIIRSLLTLGLIIGTVNIMTYAYPVYSQKLAGSFEQLNTYNTVGGLVHMVTYIAMVVRIRKNQKLDKTAKGQWTFLIILLPIVLGPYYLWVKEKQVDRNVS